MTTVTGPYPQGRSRHGPGFWVKGVVALSLLAVLGWIGLVAVQYLQTGKPIAEIASVPKPVARLVQEQPRFVDSVWNVARPLGVAVGPDGTIYVTESEGEHGIRSFAPGGSARAAFGASGPDQPTNNPAYVAVSPAGKVYVSDMMRHTISIFSSSGQPEGEVPSPLADGWTPMALAFGKTGNLYVTDFTPGQHRVLVLDPAGNLLRQFGREGPIRGEFSFPNGIAVDTKGNIYVADSGNGRVQAFDKDANLLWAIGRGTGKGDLGMPRGIAVDESRHLLLVVDATDHAVNVYDIAGATPKFLYLLGTGPAAVESLSYPNGIALDDSGRIYVADRQNHRVAVWRY